MLSGQAEDKAGRLFFNIAYNPASEWSVFSIFVSLLVFDPRLGAIFVCPRLGATKQKGQRSWRKAVTGSPDTRIRDYIKGVPQVTMSSHKRFAMFKTVRLL